MLDCISFVQPEKCASICLWKSFTPPSTTHRKRMRVASGSSPHPPSDFSHLVTSLKGQDKEVPHLQSSPHCHLSHLISSLRERLNKGTTCIQPTPHGDYPHLVSSLRERLDEEATRVQPTPCDDFPHLVSPLKNNPDEPAGGGPHLLPLRLGGEQAMDKDEEEVEDVLCCNKVEDSDEDEQSFWLLAAQLCARDDDSGGGGGDALREGDSVQLLECSGGGGAVRCQSEAGVQPEDGCSDGAVMSSWDEDNLKERTDCDLIFEKLLC